MYIHRSTPPFLKGLAGLKQSYQALLAAAVVVAMLVAGLAIFFPRNSGGASSGALPGGCAKSSGGFLIIASNLGFNDSIQHGAPTTSWPVITVHQGQRVDIAVCNTDIEAHGLQITHYIDSTIESVAPGQVIHMSFIANQQGNFDVYCSIFCGIHPFMQNGLLKVVP